MEKGVKKIVKKDPKKAVFEPFLHVFCHFFMFFSCAFQAKKGVFFNSVFNIFDDKTKNGGVGEYYKMFLMPPPTRSFL